MNLNKYIIWTLLLVFSTGHLFSQLQQFQKPDIKSLPAGTNTVKDSTIHFKAIGKYTKEGIKIRWAPVNEEYWRLYNKKGYIVQRFSYDTLGNMDRGLIQISDTIRPWTFTKFKEYLTKSKNEPYVGVVAQNLYGKTPSAAYKEWTDYSDELQNRYAFTLLAAEYSPTGMESAGLGYIDTQVLKNRFYQYRIIGIRDEMSSLDTFDLYLNTFEIDELMTPTIEEPLIDDKMVGFSWNRLAHSQYFSGYFIERSEDGKNFIPLNKSPYINPISNTLPQNDRMIKWNDKTISNYKKYYYRIKGISPYGEVSLPSNVLILTGVDKTPPQMPRNVNAEYLGGSRVKITWEYDAKEGDLAGFMIGRSRKANESFENITGNLPLNNGKRMFIDSFCVESTTNFYIVAAVDTAKNAAASLVSYAAILDSVPPSKPKGLVGNIDTIGVVTLHWPLGDELDIKGYFIWSANASDHVYINITPVPVQDTIWRDTISLKTLTKDIYFKIQAVDRMSNSSAHSEPIRLLKPDIVPPVAPVITDYKVETDRVVLSWQKSTSPDVSHHRVLRKARNEELWTIVARVQLKQASSFVDYKILKNYSYHYSVVAVDSSDNISEMARPVQVKTQIDLKNPITDFAIQRDTLLKQVTLQWTDLPDVPYKEIIIYKSIDKGAVKSLARVKKKDGKVSNLFIDNKVFNSNTYEYTCKVVYDKGLTSNFGVLSEAKILP